MPLSQVPRPPDPSRVAALLTSRRPDDPGQPAAARLEASLRASRRPGVVTVPEQLRMGRLAVPTGAVVALLALVVAVGSLFLVRVLWAERDAGPGTPIIASTTSVTGRSAIGDPSATGSLVPTGSPGPSGGAGGSTGAGGTGQIVVHVVGQVRRPGLVRLRPGSRVADAITAAGGATRQADLAAVNLARLLTDGEQIYLPRPGETPPAPSPVSGAAGAAGAAGTGSDATGPVDLNTADQAALETLPGVGPVLAGRIIDWRSAHGRFSTVDELREVSGIGDKLFARLQPKVTV